MLLSVADHNFLSLPMSFPDTKLFFHVRFLLSEWHTSATKNIVYQDRYFKLQAKALHIATLA